MTHKQCGEFQNVSTRRDLLRQSGAGFGLLALHGLLGQHGASGGGASAGENPLAARLPHFAPRAKRVIFLFMHALVLGIRALRLLHGVEREKCKIGLRLRNGSWFSALSSACYE